MTVDYRLLGQRIRDQRRRSGQTQERLAEYLAVSVGYISQIERGVTKVSLETLFRIATYLKCDISKLLCGTAPEQADYLGAEMMQIFDRMNDHQKRLMKQIAECILQTE